MAKLLGEKFLDTDAVIVERHGPIPDIFATRGEAWFRQEEAEVVREALSGDGVVALGGGAVTSPSVRQLLKSERVVLLSISEEAVAHRVTNSPKRPLLKGGVDAWRKLVAERQAWYDECATITVEVSHRNPEDVASEIIAWLEAEETQRG